MKDGGRGEADTHIHTPLPSDTHARARLPSEMIESEWGQLLAEWLDGGLALIM